MHDGYCWILFWENLRIWFKSTHHLCKRSQTFRYSSHHRWFVGDVNFMQNIAGIFWRWCLFTSSCGLKLRMAHGNIPMEFSNMKIVQTIACIFDTHIHCYLFVVNQTPLFFCIMFPLSIYHWLQWMVQKV